MPLLLSVLNHRQVLLVGAILEQQAQQIQHAFKTSRWAGVEQQSLASPENHL